jgi:polysaccharide deacetylase 2 family uncharacterized protein YibQ
LAIVIDDVGYNLNRAEQLLEMPVQLTLGLLPFAPHAQAIASRAAQSGREIILHQPMEPIKTSRTEPGTLELSMTAARFDREFSAALARLPQVSGVNNHTGSLLTAHRVPMEWLMANIASRGLYFLDSRTTPHTVAESTARDWQVPTIRRDVFLDHVRTPEFLDAAFNRALQIARRKGYAVIIAHPHRMTLDFLKSQLSDLPSDIRLTTLSDLIARDHQPVELRPIDRPVDRPIDRRALALSGTPEFPSRSLGQ